MNELISQLKEEKFDYIIDLHHNIRTLRIKSALKNTSFSFPKLNIKKWFLVNFKINFLPDIHIVDRYFDTLKIIKVVNDQKGLDYFLPDEETETSSSIFSKIPGKYIALVIGAQHETKKATPGLLAQICDRADFPVVILGGKNDKEFARSILSQLTVNQAIWDTTGELTLNQSARLVKNSELVITNDTGLMHIAAAYKKKIISIWGSTIPEFGMYPYLPDPESKIFEVKGLGCRPCSKIGYQSCPKKHFKCMKNQDVDEIVFWIKKQILV